MFSCCNAPKQTKLWTGGLLFVAALICFFAVGPVYVTMLATPTERFVDCAQCASTYVTDVMKTVNGTSIVEKIKDAHDRNQQFHRGRDKPDVCITDEDLDNLNLDHVDIDPLPQSCIDTCAPIGRKVPLAMACAGATCFAAIAILVCSLAAFCSFCCCNPTEPPTYVMVENAPSTSHRSGSQQPTGTASYTDPIKQPLMSGSP